MPSGFQAYPYSLPLRTRYRWAKGDHDTRSGILISCDLDGAEGWGEIAYGPHVEMDWSQQAHDVATRLHGIDPTHEEALAQIDALALHPRDRCGVVTALMTAQAAAAGLPLAQFLGANPAPLIPINGLVNKDAPEDAVAQAQEYALQGMTTFKIKCFENVAHDIERVRALRDAFPDASLRLDPNDAWLDVDSTLRNMEALAAFEIDYVEDPLDTKTASVRDMALLRAHGPAIRVAWDNPVERLADMEALLEAEAVDVFIFKMPRAGGPDRQLDMIRCAVNAGKEAVMTGPLETAVGTMAGHHLAALLPRPLPHCGFSLSQHFALDIAELSPIAEGERRLSTSPGLGLEPEPQRLGVHH